MLPVKLGFDLLEGPDGLVIAEINGIHARYEGLPRARRARLMRRICDAWIEALKERDITAVNAHPTLYETRQKTSSDDVSYRGYFALRGIAFDTRAEATLGRSTPGSFALNPPAIEEVTWRKDLQTLLDAYPEAIVANPVRERERILDWIGDGPAIEKRINGVRGAGIRLVSSLSDRDEPHVYQRYVPSRKDGEHTRIRYVVLEADEPAGDGYRSFSDDPIVTRASSTRTEELSDADRERVEAFVRPMMPSLISRMESVGKPALEDRLRSSEGTI